MQGELTGGEVRIYSDDISVARWLQRTIETLLHPPFADEGGPGAAGGVHPRRRPALHHRGDRRVGRGHRPHDLVRLHRAVHPERSARRRGPAAGSALHLHPGRLRPARVQRPGRDRVDLAREARRSPVLERGAGLVGVLAQAPRGERRRRNPAIRRRPSAWRKAHDDDERRTDRAGHRGRHRHRAGHRARIRRDGRTGGRRGPRRARGRRDGRSGRRRGDGGPGRRRRPSRTSTAW